MKFLQLCLVVLVFIFSGCTTTNVNQAPVISTYNTSSNASKQKSTKTYPGSAPQAKVEQYTVNNAYEDKMPSKSNPTTMTTTTSIEPMPSAPSTPIIAMATPTPSSDVETQAEPIIQPRIAMPMRRATVNNGPMIKIAVLVPQKTIKKYAITSVNSVMSYLLYQNYNFDLNVFNSGDEREESILAALKEIKAGEYNYIIAPLTPEGAQIVANYVKDTMVYIPTLHSSSVRNASSNIFFGGIDYDQQIALLSQFTNEKVGTFEDGTSLSIQLNSLVKKNSPRVFYEKRIENSKANFKQLFKGNASLNNASFYLNTPLVTTSLIASQLRANEIFPNALLSTQINYNPILLTLTQYEDRDKMFIANSIQRTPAELEEINAFFGHDIVYDWVNYSTSIGADFLCNQFFGSKSNKAFKEIIQNNQVIYNTAVYKPGRNEFVKVNPKIEN